MTEGWRGRQIVYQMQILNSKFTLSRLAYIGIASFFRTPTLDSLLYKK